MTKSKKHTITIEDFKKSLMDGEATFKLEIAGSYGVGPNKALLMVTEISYNFFSDVSIVPVARVKYHVMQDNQLYWKTSDIELAINSYNDLP